MRKKALVAGAAVLLIGGAIAALFLWRSEVGVAGAKAFNRPVLPGSADGEAVARLDQIPLYRSIVKSHAVRSGFVDAHGVLHVEIDLRAALEPRLDALGLPGGAELLPEAATGTIADDSQGASAPSHGMSESWSFDGPAAALELLDRRPEAQPSTVALDAIPGSPSAMARVRLAPSRLTDPHLGGVPLAAWRDRVIFVENLLGRSVRAELAEDLAGPAAFALYDGASDETPEAVFVAELRRSDRIASLLDMAFGLGALTERASASRYRGVLTGSFGSRSAGGGLALAVDGPILIVATSRARLEAAIDAHRAVEHPRPALAPAALDDASWSAASASSFVRRSWFRPARPGDPDADGPLATTTATLRPEGATGWRLEGHGPGPAISADPILPFLRGTLGRRQRGVD